MKSINVLVYFLLPIFLCSCKAQEKIDISMRVYFVPNNYSTYNYGRATFRNEYKDYGAYFDVKNEKLISEFNTILSKLKKTKGGRFGKRIKIIVSRDKATDTVYMPYLPKAKIDYNGVAYSGNAKLFNLVVNMIKQQYEKSDYVCEGEKCDKIPKKQNIEFLDQMIKSSEKHLSKKE